MKPSQSKLGLAIQLFLMRQGIALDALAQAVGMTADGLSNLIHGRRRFKDDTLVKLAETEYFRNGRFGLKKLKALRAMDEYSFEELILGIVEYVKLGEIERLPKGFFEQFRSDMEEEGFPQALADKKHALLALMKIDHE